jgi:hypothetical protein
MQPFDDLQNVWMMFDDVKRVQGWMTMACHIYDSIYCKVIMIVVYDMQSKDTKVQHIHYVEEAECSCWEERIGYTCFQSVHGG